MFQPRKLPHGIFHFFFFFFKNFKKELPFFCLSFLSFSHYFVLFIFLFCFFVREHLHTLAGILPSLSSHPPFPSPPPPFPPSPFPPIDFSLPSSPPSKHNILFTRLKKTGEGERRKKERERSRGCWSFWERGCQVLFSLLLAFLS